MEDNAFANRLKKAMSINGITQTELANKSNIDKSLISNYLSGNYKAKQDKLTKLANVLNVSEPWLMGFDVPISEELKEKEKEFVELELLFDKAKPHLSDDDKETMKFLMQKTINNYEKSKKENKGDD